MQIFHANIGNVPFLPNFSLVPFFLDTTFNTSIGKDFKSLSIAES